MWVLESNMRKLSDGVVSTKRNTKIYSTLLRCIGAKSVPRLYVRRERKGEKRPIYAGRYKTRHDDERSEISFLFAASRIVTYGYHRLPKIPWQFIITNNTGLLDSLENCLYGMLHFYRTATNFSLTLTFSGERYNFRSSQILVDPTCTMVRWQSWCRTCVEAVTQKKKRHWWDKYIYMYIHIGCDGRGGGGRIWNVID